jgi:hypothetical protein
MRNLIEQTPSAQDEQIYEAWESGKKSLRSLARQFETSVTEIGMAIDRCLPVFDTANQMRAYKREIQKLEDVGTKYYAKALEGDLDSGHLYARLNERYCAMQGWSSVHVHLDPYQAQVKEKPSQHLEIRNAIFRLKYGPAWKPEDSFDADGNLLPHEREDDENREGNGKALAPVADEDKGGPIEPKRPSSET